jgi:UTP--glucose-1-phosphate uridylyltransferase
MKVTKAVITVASRSQRTLPLQTLIDRDGLEKSVLNILIDEVVMAGVDEIGIVVYPGDESAYQEVVGNHAGRLHFVPQPEALGYGHALHCAARFTGDDPFLHLVGDHIYVSQLGQSGAQELVEIAQSAGSTVSAVQATRENLLPYYGAVGGRRVAGRSDLYRVDAVIEKPTPTEAEQRLLVPGLRAGHYLCFFGMHVLTPTIMQILAHQLTGAENPKQVTLSSALAGLARREQYLALEQQHSRYDLGVKYGLFTAQLALALQGQDRDEVLAKVVELLAQRESSARSAAL